MSDDFYPLYLGDLTQPEKELLVELFVTATTSTRRRKRLLTAKAIEDRAKKELHLPQSASFSLRSLLGGRFKPGRQLDAPQQKWVFLYNYAMGGFRELCLLHDRQDLLTLIADLHAKGVRSDRYTRDIHLLNEKYLNLRSRNEEHDERLTGSYIGFRYSSTLPNFVVSILTIRREEDRTIFSCQTLQGGEERECRGYVYEHRSRAHLFGFFGNDYHAEFYSLIVDDRNADVLHGILSTVSSSGVLHAKQCFFLRMGTIKKLEDMAKTFQPNKNSLQRLRNVIPSIFQKGEDGKSNAIWRTNTRLLSLNDFLDRDYSVQPKNAGEASQRTGA